MIESGGRRWEGEGGKSTSGSSRHPSCSAPPRPSRTPQEISGSARPCGEQSRSSRVPAALLRFRGRLPRSRREASSWAPWRTLPPEKLSVRAAPASGESRR